MATIETGSVPPSGKAGPSSYIPSIVAAVITALPFASYDELAIAAERHGWIQDAGPLKPELPGLGGGDDA